MKRDIEIVYTQEFLESQRESPWGKTQRDQKKGLEFNYEEYSEIDELDPSYPEDEYAEYLKRMDELIFENKLLRNPL